jgi:multiple sugar transport system substrate-binding protein/sn-glycerol 3-phosphate transport system substrate-binding protein
MNRKFSLLVALLVALMLFVVACGGGETETEVEEAVDEAAETVEEVADEVEETTDEVAADYNTDIYGVIDEVDLEGANVIFWHQHSGEREEELLAIVEDFNATNEFGITVEARNEGGYGDIYNKMIAGITSGEVPGLVVAYQNQAAAYMVADGLVSMDPYINHPEYGLSEDERADFFNAFLSADRLPQFGGDSFGWPPNRSMELMYYNIDWMNELAEAGAVSFEGPPQTPEQFAEAVCAAAENPFSQNPDPSFSVGYEIRTDASNVAALTWARGGEVYDEESNTFTYNNEATAAALTQMAELLEQGCASEIAERFGDQTDFGNGKTLFTMGSSSGLPFYRSAVDEGEAGGFEWSVAPIPYTTDEPTANIYGASVSIPQTDPQTQLAAWVFMKYYTSPEIQARWARASNYFPARVSVAEGLDEYFSENPAYETAFNLLQYGKTEPAVAGYDNIRDEAEEAFQRILAGEDAETVLAELDATANEILEEAAPE